MGKYTKTESLYAKCPFYKYEYFNVGAVVCEGYENASAISVRFRSCQECKIYKQKYCYKNFAECKVNKMLMDVWEKENK